VSSRRRLLSGLGLCLVLGLTSYAPFGGLEEASKGILEQGELFTVSVPATIQWLLLLVGIENERWFVVAVLGLLFVLGYVWLLREMPNDWVSLAASGCVAYFLFLALVWPQFHPWYLSWPLALAPFVRDSATALRLVVFSAIALLGFSFSHAWPGQQGGWQAEPQALAALAVFLPPLLLPVTWLRRLLLPSSEPLQTA
jgi:hypothetical protein